VIPASEIDVEHDEKHRRDPMNDTLPFFAAPGPLTTPGRHAGLLKELPSDVGSLVRIVQGLLIHVFWAERYGVHLDVARREEVQLRDAASKLARIVELDPRPLAEPRAPDYRLAGNCRDFSVLLVTFLRRQGIPARARCGFARYFLPDHYEDHWVGEYWHEAEQRWVLVDAQLDALQQEKLGIAFDTLDVPRDQFITGGAAWTLCRSGQADPDTFGIADMKGLWFVRGNLGRDVAALNKVELLPWDGWGLVDGIDEDPASGDLAALDEMAALSGGDVPEFERVRALYETDPRWRVPPVIHSYSAEGRIDVDLSMLMGETDRR
jgi:hypothetical protein